MLRSLANAIDAATSAALSAITIPCGRIVSKRGSNTTRAFGYAGDPGRISRPWSRSSRADHDGFVVREGADDGAEIDGPTAADDVEPRVHASSSQPKEGPATAHPAVRLR